MGCHSGSGPGFCQPLSTLGRHTAGRNARGRMGLRVQTTLALLGLFPPPATRAMVLARHDRPGAGRAADARITLLMEAVEGQLASPDVRPDLLLGPVEQRADLVQAVLRIPLDGFAFSTGLRLLAPHAGDPRIVPGHEFLERYDLAGAAAGAARLGAVKEAVDTLARHQVRHILAIRVNDPDLVVVATLQLGEQLVALLVQPTGVDADDIDFRNAVEDDVRQHHGFGAKAVRVHQSAVFLYGCGQEIADLSGLRFQFQG